MFSSLCFSEKDGESIPLVDLNQSDGGRRRSRGTDDCTDLLSNATPVRSGVVSLMLNSQQSPASALWWLNHGLDTSVIEFTGIYRRESDKLSKSEGFLVARARVTIESCYPHVHIAEVLNDGSATSDLVVCSCTSFGTLFISRISLILCADDLGDSELFFMHRFTQTFTVPPPQSQYLPPTLKPSKTNIRCFTVATTPDIFPRALAMCLLIDSNGFIQLVRMESDGNFVVVVAGQLPFPMDNKNSTLSALLFPTKARTLSVLISFGSTLRILSLQSDNKDSFGQLPMIAEHFFSENQLVSDLISLPSLEDSLHFCCSVRSTDGNDDDDMLVFMKIPSSSEFNFQIDFNRYSPLLKGSFVSIMLNPSNSSNNKQIWILWSRQLSKHHHQRMPTTRSLLASAISSSSSIMYALDMICPSSIDSHKPVIQSFTLHPPCPLMCIAPTSAFINSLVSVISHKESSAISLYSSPNPSLNTSSDLSTETGFLSDLLWNQIPHLFISTEAKPSQSLHSRLSRSFMVWDNCSNPLPTLPPTRDNLFTKGLYILSGLTEASAILASLMQRVLLERSFLLDAPEFSQVELLMDLRGMPKLELTPEDVIRSYKEWNQKSLDVDTFTSSLFDLISQRAVVSLLQAELLSRLIYLVVSFIAWRTTRHSTSLTSSNASNGSIARLLNQLRLVAGTLGTVQVAGKSLLKMIHPAKSTEILPHILRLFIPSNSTDLRRVESIIFPYQVSQKLMNAGLMESALVWAQHSESFAHTSAATSHTLALQMFVGFMDLMSFQKHLQTASYCFVTDNDSTKSETIEDVSQIASLLKEFLKDLPRMSGSSWNNLWHLRNSIIDGFHKCIQLSGHLMLFSNAFPVLYRQLMIQALLQSPLVSTVTLHYTLLSDWLKDARILHLLAQHASKQLPERDEDVDTAFVATRHWLIMLSRFLFSFELFRGNARACLQLLQQMATCTEHLSLPPSSPPPPSLRAEHPQHILSDCVSQFVAQSLDTGLLNGFLSLRLCSLQLAVHISSTFFQQLEHAFSDPSFSLLDKERSRSVLIRGPMVLVAFLVQRGAQGTAAAIALHFSARLRGLVDISPGGAHRLGLLLEATLGLLSTAVNLTAQIPKHIEKENIGQFDKPSSVTSSSLGKDVIQIQPLLPSDIEKLRRLLTFTQTEWEVGAKVMSQAISDISIPWWMSPSHLISPMESAEVAKQPRSLMLKTTVKVREDSSLQIHTTKLIELALIQQQPKYLALLRCAALIKPDKHRLTPIIAWVRSTLQLESKKFETKSYTIACDHLITALKRFTTHCDNCAFLEAALQTAIKDSIKFSTLIHRLCKLGQEMSPTITARVLIEGCEATQLNYSEYHVALLEELMNLLTGSSFNDSLAIPFTLRDRALNLCSSVQLDRNSTLSNQLCTFVEKPVP